MIEAFQKGEDIHRVTAAQVLGISPDEVTKDQRSNAKAVNFGIVYGIGEYSLSQDLKISVKQAKEYINNYLNKYSGVREYMKKIKDIARKNGHVETLMKRRRYIPEITSSNFNTRAFGERVALNTPIQGTAADIIKLAMVRIYRRLKDEGFRSKLILQVHDELIIETYPEEKQRVREILKSEMENAMKLSVPLVVDMSEGKSWYDAK
ncbi:MAG: DNA polymerase I, partial [Firmicutes bacterium]|nr:DNA polymerase I [Bacillota bacterium]